jgi:crotonobetainyl-CoA:carnitine CoA-transferase CaiB-like acyl-CoA transferase
MKNNKQTGPLAGVKVVELGLWIAGPAAAAMMADWGADVIKVEPPSGDPARNALASIIGMEGDITSPPFEADNRGKRSMVLDLTERDNIKVLEKLLATSDVFISNIRPAALARLGLSPEQLIEKFPKLVVAQVTGYGSGGPEMNRPGYDSGSFWAYSGLAEQFSGETGNPPPLPGAVGDHITAIALVSGITAALFDCQRTGKGSIVETSLLKLGIYSLTSAYSLLMGIGRPQPPARRVDFDAPLVNNYCASDGKTLWLLCVESGRHWPTLINAIGHPELADDERFKNTKSRHKHRVALIERLGEIFAEKPRAEWAQILDSNDVWWAPVNSLEDVIASEQAQYINAFPALHSHGDGQTVNTVATPIDFNRAPTLPSGIAPSLGADTQDILKELGVV